MRGSTISGGLAWLVASTLSAAEAEKSNTSAYEQLIAPIFRARCIECHGDQKQKAKLALHTWEGLARGSDAGPVIVAGKPGESILLERLRLSSSDEEHMPPSDQPQPAPEEIEILARWVGQGASLTATLSELQLPESLAKAAALLPAKLEAIARTRVKADPLWEFDPVAVEKSRAPLATAVAALQRRFPGALSYESRTSAALHFTAVGFGRSFDDAALAELLPVRDQLVFVDVAGTGITDASAPVLARFTRLRALRAGFTALGDATSQKLAALTNLESLSLPGTNVSAASVEIFTKLRALRSLRVAGTPAEQAAQAANLPVVPSAADLVPPPETPLQSKAP